MSSRDWKQELKDHFDGIRIIDKCKAETISNFDQFSEFIVEPAYEALADELKSYGVESKFRKIKEKEVFIAICFPESKDEQFRYKLVILPNSVELKLLAVVEGRRTRRSNFITKSEPFMPGLKTNDILKMDKEEIILHLLDRYRTFIYESLTTPD